LASKEQLKTQFLQVSRLNSIKTKIILFALIATIIPSVTMGWLSYVQNKRFLSEKITQELRIVTAQVSREVALWLNGRLNDAVTYSVSGIVLKNREKIFRTDGVHIEKIDVLRQLKEYLRSLRGKFDEYEELMLVDLSGNIVATSTGQANPVKMPDKWLDKAQSDKPIIGNPYFDAASQTVVMVIAHPIQTDPDRLFGVLAIKLNFRAIGNTLKIYAHDETMELHLITKEGALLVSSQSVSVKSLRKILTQKTVQKLFSRERVPLKYIGYRGKAVVATLKKVPDLDWGVVAEKDREKAYVQIVRLRNLTLALFAGVLVLIGLCAYFLGLTIARPLGRLTAGADKVAAGDLGVDLPVHSHSEVGYLTEVFNHMVARLRHGREELAAANEALLGKNKELEELSITDSLTGLYNRKHLMETLTGEVARSLRHQRPFVLLIIDIDHFKDFNDTYGHLAGDEVLRRMGAVFKGSIRNCDYAARYGGEEFIVILPEIGPEDGVQAAERIRHRVAEEKISSNGDSVTVTISVGVASFPEHGDDAETMISKADSALYQAKKRGRNRVVLAGSGRKKKRQKAQ
jgi:diguanylate cyclase (GGDEF)-like protein